MCIKANMGQPGHIEGWLESRGNSGAWVCAATSQLQGKYSLFKTLYSNHRITTHGTEMLFHTKRKITKKYISELLSTKAKLWLLTVLHSVHYQCVNLIVCAHVCVCPLTLYCIPSLCFCQTISEDSVVLQLLKIMTWYKTIRLHWQDTYCHCPARNASLIWWHMSQSKELSCFFAT